METLAKRGILTLAVGKKFNRQAKYLAYSCILHSASLPRAIITDECDCFKDLYDIIIPYTADMGDPFRVKLRLHHYTPFYETLYLDSDMLVYKDLHFMWDYFDDQSIVYPGACLKSGEWYFKEVEKVLEHLQIPWIGGFNSGCFVFRKDEIVCNMFEFADKLHKHHDGLDVPFFRDKMLPDEPFLAIAFGKYNQLPLEDYGRMGASLIGAHSVRLDVISGFSKFFKNGQICFPAIVHFIGDYYQLYFREKLKLLFYFKLYLYGVVSNCFVNIVYVLVLPFLVGVKMIKWLKKRVHSA